MKCPVCRRGDEIRAAYNAMAWCRRCHILTQKRPGAKLPGEAKFRGKRADEFFQAVAERGIPPTVAT